MDVRIVGMSLPGRSWGDQGPGGCLYRNIHVGIQRKAEVVDLVAGDADGAVWDLTMNVVDIDGGVDFRGPFVQGRRASRFVYLSWGDASDDGRFEMFRRAKIMLDALDRDTLGAADRTGARLVGRLGLTGRRGGPLCAAVRPPAIDWSVAPA